MNINAVKAAEIMQGTVNGMDDKLVFTGVSTDTRCINAGDIFIAIKGENFDGAEYIEAAFDKGAVCAVTSKNTVDPRVIIVDDPIIALGALAHYHRCKYEIPVIAVTGSVGKTTVKNMLISVLGQKYSVHSTSGNKNNHIGLPMSIMDMDESHEISILEMGMNNLGEIDYLSKIAQPDYAVITNIGMSHIGILGSRENILKAKSEVMNHMKEGGIAFVNGDDDMLMNIEPPKGLKILRFGTVENSDYTAHDITMEDNGNCVFTSDGTRFRLPVPGGHNAVNAMGVIAIARLLGIGEEQIQKGFMEFTQSKMRMHIYKYDGVTYINDAYNANPQSMKAALDILKSYSGRKIAVLGDMLEMGDFSKKEHVKIGDYAAGIADVLLLCGLEARNMKAGALEVKAGCMIKTFKISQDAAEILKDLVKPGDAVLVKGSRGMMMENVLEYTNDGGQK